MKIDYITMTPHFGTAYSEIEIKGFMKTSEIPNDILDCKVVFEKINKNQAQEARENSLALLMDIIYRRIKCSHSFL